MKQFSSLQLQLLQQLADGNCHSGSVLGKQAGVSRTAVWKQISQLTELGLKIKRFPQQGYQLAAPLELLNENRIGNYLQATSFQKAIHFNLFASIDSTNRFLKELPESSLIEVCCAETQTQGRGRFGRHWVSPFGENIYCSSRWVFNCCLSQLSGLSLVVGLAILSSLADHNLHQELKIKWPNDLMWQDKKLAGILIEIIAETNGCAQVIIGIGMNVNTATYEQALPEKPWCSLYEITGQYFDRNLLIAHLIHNLSQHLDQFLTEGLSAFKQAWKKVDYLYGKNIQISQPTGSLNGKACGINEAGLLCLQTDDGRMHYLSCGDTSLSSLEQKNL